MQPAKTPACLIGVCWHVAKWPENRRNCADFGPTGFALQRRLAYRLPLPLPFARMAAANAVAFAGMRSSHRGFFDETDSAPGPVRDTIGCVGVPSSSGLSGTLLDTLARLRRSCLPTGLPSGGAKRAGDVRAVRPVVLVAALPCPESMTLAVACSFPLNRRFATLRRAWLL